MECCGSLVAFLVFVITPVVWYKLTSTSSKEKFTVMFMGLREGRRKSRSHSVLRTAEFQSLADYYKLLRRDSRQTFTKIPRVFEEARISVETEEHNSIRFAYFDVIYAHERRIYGWKAIPGSLLRFGAISVMVGTIDHFYVDGKLVAFSHTVIKGDTLRAMWFYQKQEVSRSLIWFYAVQKAISRAISTPGVKYVDLGPSFNLQVKEAKQKLNFEDLENWRQVCDYSGSFKDPVDVKSDVIM